MLLCCSWSHTHFAEVGLAAVTSTRGWNMWDWHVRVEWEECVGNFTSGWTWWAPSFLSIPLPPLSPFLSPSLLSFPLSLVQYTTSEPDPLVEGVRKQDNPFIKKSSCTILWSVPPSLTYIATGEARLCLRRARLFYGTDLVRCDKLPSRISCLCSLSNGLFSKHLIF